MEEFESLFSKYNFVLRKWDFKDVGLQPPQERGLKEKSWKIEMVNHGKSCNMKQLQNFMEFYQTCLQNLPHFDVFFWLKI